MEYNDRREGEASAKRKEVKPKRVLFISSYSYAWEIVPEKNGRNSFVFYHQI